MEVKQERTSLFDDVEGAMNDVVELEGIISIGEALYVEQIVLFMDPKVRNRNIKATTHQ